LESQGVVERPRIEDDPIQREVALVEEPEEVPPGIEAWRRRTGREKARDKLVSSFRDFRSGRKVADDVDIRRLGDIYFVESPEAAATFLWRADICVIQSLVFKEVRESKKPSYNDVIPSPEAATAWLPPRMGETTREFADRKGMTVAQLEEAADEWQARGGTGARTSAADELANVMAIEDSTLLRQWHTYKKLLAKVGLPLQTLDDARNATNLANTYSNARARQKKGGIELVPENDVYIKQVASAASMFFQRKKSKAAALD
jgi:hypothetical protein